VTKLWLLFKNSKSFPDVIVFLLEF